MTEIFDQDLQTKAKRGRLQNNVLYKSIYNLII